MQGESVLGKKRHKLLTNGFKFGAVLAYRQIDVFGRQGFSKHNQNRHAQCNEQKPFPLAFNQRHPGPKFLHQGVPGVAHQGGVLQRMFMGHCVSNGLRKAVEIKAQPVHLQYLPAVDNHTTIHGLDGSGIQMKSFLKCVQLCLRYFQWGR